MKHAIFISFLFLFSFKITKAQTIFFEDFQQGIPASFTLINGDNKTPHSQVAFVNDAWVAHEWDVLTHDTAAVSTSWYDVPAQADDWLITPAIQLTGKSTLSWKAFATDPDYRDGYEVRISTSGNDVSDFTTVLFSTAAEQSFPNVRYVSLQPYTGQTVYIAFRNNSFNQNLLAIDDIKVELKPPFDAGILSSKQATSYTIIPRSQGTDFQPQAVVINDGDNDLNDVQVFCTIHKNGALQSIDSNAVSFLGSGLVSSFNFLSYTPNDTGLYELNYFTKIQQVDGNALNDSMKYSLLVNDTVYARDNGIATSSISMGVPAAEIGHWFEIFHPAKVSSASVYLHKPEVGAKLQFRLYSFGSAPQVVVDTTLSYTTTLNDSLNGKLLTLDFINRVKMQTGKYLLVAAAQNSKDINIGTCDALQSKQVNWIRFTGNPFGHWATGDAYDSLLATQAYTKVLAMRLNIESACVVQPDFEMNIKPTCTNTGVISLINYTSENPAPYAYQWSNNTGGTSISNLIPGVYTLSVTDGFNCVFTHTDTIKNDPIRILMSVEDVTCWGAKNGKITANATGGNGNYSYMWNTDSVQTSQTAGALKTGVYEVTVTDGSCVTTARAVVEEPANLMRVTVAAKANPSSEFAQDGSIIVTATQGQPPYQYVWNDSVTQPQISNIGAGTYCVTVTDNSGCVVELCDSIGFGLAVHEIAMDDFKIFPIPAYEHLSVETMNTSTFEIRLWSQTGALIFKEQFERSINVSTSQFAAGSYVLEIKNSEESTRKRVVIMR